MKRYKVKVAVLALPSGRVVEGTVLDEKTLLLGFMDPEKALSTMLERGVIEPVEEEATPEGAKAEEPQGEPTPEGAQEEAPVGEEPTKAEGAPKGGKKRGK